ncbi:unnamed protein product [Soboliphyme baturini]|uniref:S-adenosyl-L-methionine-dependent methyltransferase superfamily protein n=1 Tax=Soboliphyme baturini TaxID=241478 RepID=A0A183IG41_9BILA|nr:unnamed protein product [Soboliphyme baturini]
MCFESLMMQPGLTLSNILVAYDPSYPEIVDLSALYNFTSVGVEKSGSKSDFLAGSFEAVWSKFPNASYVIVLEEGTLLSPDFLYFMSQVFPVFASDSKLATISGWNENACSVFSFLRQADNRRDLHIKANKNVVIDHPSLLKEDSYDRNLSTVISEAMLWDVKGCSGVEHLSEIKIPSKAKRSTSLKVFFSDDPTNRNSLAAVASCFGLRHSNAHPLINLYKGDGDVFERVQALSLEQVIMLKAVVYPSADRCSGAAKRLSISRST